MTAAALETLTVSHTFAAPRERVYRAWTTAEEVQQWFGRPEGFEISRVVMDARVGGSYRIEIGEPPALGVIVGTYKEVAPSRRLVFSFEWETASIDVMDTGETVVTVEFNDLDEGTEVVIVHELLRDENVVAFHRFGWEAGWPRLEKLLET